MGGSTRDRRSQRRFLEFRRATTSPDDQLPNAWRLPLIFGWELALVRRGASPTRRPVTSHRVFITSAIIGVVVLVGVGILVTNKKLSAQTFTWVQNAWTGGATANTAIHPANQTGWTQYAANDSTISAGASLSLATTTQSLADTTDTDFAGGAQSSTAVSGTGTSALEQLSLSEGATPTFTQYVAYGFSYEYDAATNSVWVSGANQTLTKYAADGSSTTALATLSLSSYATGTVQMAYDPVLGVLWALGKSGANNNLNLIKINVTTAAVISSTAIESDASGSRDIRYDSANDVLWISYGWTSGSRIIKVDKTGTVLLTIASNTAVELAVDPGTSSIWYVDGGSTVYRQPESGAAATTISLGGSYGTTAHIIYESATPAVWATSEQYSFGGYHRILTSNNAVTSKSDAELSNGIAYDSVHDVIWTTDSLQAKVFKINRATPGVITSYTPSNAANSSRPFYDPSTRSLWLNAGGSGQTKRMTFVAYAASGNFTSRIFDTTANTTFGNATWTASVPASTTAVVKARSSNSATMSGAPAWSGCGALTSGQSPTTGGCVTNGQRYIQYNVAFTTSNTAVTPNLQDLTFTYNSYTNGTLTSSPFDTSDTANVVAKLQWSTSGTGMVNFRLRTSADGNTWTSWLGPTGTSDYYTDNTGGQAINATNHDGASDRYVQYRAYLTSADGVTTPTVSSVTITYVVNAPPEIQATPTAVENADGTVTITYAIRDTDASTDTGSVGVLTPSFEYSTDNGAHWSSITSGLPGSATTPKAVDTITPLNYTSYSAVWTARSLISGTYSTQTKIRITVNDEQGANNTAVATTANFVLDLKSPTLGATPIVVDASTAPASILLSATDDSTLQMCVTLDNSQTNCGAYAASTTLALETDPDTVYVIFRDAYGNTASANAVTPPTPTNLVIRDISNPPTNEYQLFLTWAATTLAANQFTKYEVYQSTTGQAGSYSIVANITDKTINYYLHKGLVASSTHYYKITTVDGNGNESYFSSAINGTANGQGGGTDVVPPNITNVVVSAISTQSAKITWDTDELSNSTVGYSTTAGHFDTEIGIATMVDHPGGIAAHSVVISGLTPNTAYYLRVKSTDPSGNTAFDTHGGDGYSFSTLAGPVISGVTTTSVDNSSATINWHTDVAAGSVVTYSTSAVLLSPTSISAAALVTDHSVTLTGLTLGTKYYYTVQSGVASDTNGGQNYTFTTTQDTTAPSIANVTVAPITDTQAVVTWTTSERATSQVAYGLSPGSHPTTTTYDQNLNVEHAVTISGLTAHTTYYFIIHSNDSSNNASTSAEFSFQTTYNLIEQTPDAVPPVISGHAAAPVTDSQAVIQWTTDEGATSRVDYGLATGQYSAHVGPDATRNLTHFMALTNLTAATVYYYTITSVDQWGNSATSPEYTFTTLHTLVEQTPSVTPPQITNLTFDPVTDSSIVVHWLTDVPSSSQVAFGTTTGSHPTNTTIDQTLNLSHTVTLTSLNPHTTYFLVVVSTDRWNNTATSGESNVTTHYQLVEQTPSANVPIISNITVSPILDTQAVVQWTTDVKTTARIDFGLASGVLTSHLGPDGAQNITHALTLPHLTANTKYYFTVTAVDQWGNLTTSGEQSFTTLHDLTEQIPTTVPPVISSVTIEPISDTAAVIRWVTDVLATAQVSYGRTPGVYTTTTTLDASRNVVHTVTIKNLVASTTYYFTISAVDQWGNSSTSDEHSFTTSETLIPSSTAQALIDAAKNAHPADVTPPTVTGITISNLTSDAAEVTWTSDEPANSFVQFGPTAADQLVFGNWAYVADHQIHLLNLQPQTTYTVRVVSADLSGNTTIAPAVTLTTLALSSSALEAQLHNQVQAIQQQAQTLPGPVIGGQPKVDVTTTTATITWSTDKPANSFIHYATDAEFAAKRTYGQNVGDPSHYLTTHVVKLGNLSPATVYHFQISSTTDVGQTSNTSDATFQTPKQQFAIDNYSVDTPDTQTAIFRWTTNDVATGVVQITPYRNNVLAVDEMQKTNDQTKSLIHQVSLSTLEPGTLYKVQLLSTNAAGAISEKVIDAFGTSSSGQPPVISQIRVDSALSPGTKVKVQTIISWSTDSPSTSQVYWRQGVGQPGEALANSTPLDAAYTKHHVVVITTFDPGAVYQLRLESKNSNGQVATSKPLTTLTPQQEQTVFQVITNTFSQVFGWTRLFGG